MLATILSGSPARADSDTGSSVVNVEVSSAIALTDLTASFTMTGAPGETVASAVNVTMTVTTNNFAGYVVTVQPASGALVGAIPGNTDVVSSDALEVRGPDQAGTFANLIIGTALPVDTKASASDPAGDTVTNEFRLTIPSVRPDTYSGSLDYVVTTL